MAPRLAAATAALLLPALLGPFSAPALAQVVAPQLASLAAGYGPEAWKDEPPVGRALGGAPGLPVPLPGPGFVGVYENPYANLTLHQGPSAWLGYNLTATVELRDSAGQLDASPTHTIAARLEVGAGAIPAKLARLAGGRFTAQFDLDGENGQAFPAALPGPARIVVEVYQVSPDPTVAPARIATAEFPLEVRGGRLDRGGASLDEAALPGYADVGAGNLTFLIAEQARPGQAMAVVAFLGAPDEPARVVAWHRDQGKVVAQGRTDAAGRFAASFDPGQLTGGNRSGLVVLAAALDGTQGRLGDAVAALAVSGHATRVVRYAYQARSIPGTDTGLGAADALLVGVEDLTAMGERPVRGLLHLLEPSGAAESSTPFDPSSFAPSSTERVARVPAVSLPGLATYRVLSMLLTEDGRLYSMAHAVRGLAVEGGHAEAAPFQRAELPVIVRNFNNNLDAVRDPGMALPVHVVVSGLPGGEAYTTDKEVEESGELRLAVPFSGDAGTYALAINVTSGELRHDLKGSIVVRPPPRGFFGLPGFEAALALAALAAVALQRARTRR